MFINIDVQSKLYLSFNLQKYYYTKDGKYNNIIIS